MEPGTVTAAVERDARCPKCGVARGDEPECTHCGIVFRKFAARQVLPADDAVVGESVAVSAAVLTAAGATGLRELLLPTTGEVDPWWFAGRAVVLAGLVVWSGFFLTASMASGYAIESFLHNVNLLFHEAGHIIFRPFGELLTVLGGSLLQLLMPLLCAGTFLIKERNVFGAAVALWWVGENFLDIAPYVNDARARVLPLLGGVTGRDVPGYHDWEVILGRLGWLRQDHLIAMTLHGIGVVLMVGALGWGWVVLHGQFRRLRASG